MVSGSESGSGEEGGEGEEEDDEEEWFRAGGGSKIGGFSILNMSARLMP